MINYSVIIPIYNMEKYLEECIKSILIFEREDVEVILVNDGSTDNSINICNQYEKKFKNVIVIDKKNTGTTDTIIEGVKKATGRYISFVDADDYICNNYFDVLDNYIKNDYEKYIKILQLICK